MDLTKVKRQIKFILLIIAFNLTSCQGKVKNTWKQEDGYIANESSAIKIAEIVWLNVYGSDINNEKPFHAKLRNGKVWVVEGSINVSEGGVAYIEIQRSDGKILKVIHGK